MRSERCVIQAPRPFRVGKQVRLYRSHSRSWRSCSYRTIPLYYRLCLCNVKVAFLRWGVWDSFWGGLRKRCLLISCHLDPGLFPFHVHSMPHSEGLTEINVGPVRNRP